MTTHDTSQLDRAIARVYASPLEEFVRQRDALAKELSTAGNRDAAAAVRALRKPSRTAWALNLAAGNAESLGRLNAAIAATVTAQTSGGDVRTALVSFREAVREFADLAAREAQQAGHGLETGALVNAVLAVIGRTDSIEALRRGRLVEVPEGGGLDVLAALPDPPSLPESDASSASAAQARAEARQRSESAQAALREAASRLRLVEGRLRDAESEARAARREYERAQREAEAAASAIDHDSSH